MDPLTIETQSYADAHYYMSSYMKEILFGILNTVTCRRLLQLYWLDLASTRSLLACRVASTKSCFSFPFTDENEKGMQYKVCGE